MKRVVVLILFMVIAIFTYGQTNVTKKIDDPPKKTDNKEAVKTVPKSQQNQAQIKKAQTQKKKTKQVARKAKAIRRKKNG